MTKSFSMLIMIVAVVSIVIATMVYVPIRNACADGLSEEVASEEVTESIVTADEELPTPYREGIDTLIEQVHSLEGDVAGGILLLGIAEIYCDDVAEALIELLETPADEFPGGEGLGLLESHVLVSLGTLADRSPRAAGALCAFLHEVKDDTSEVATFRIADALSAITRAGPAASAAWGDVLEIVQTTEDEYVYRQALTALLVLGVWDAEIEAFLLGVVQGDVPDAVAASDFRASRAAAIALGRIGFGEETRDVLTEIVETWVQSDRYPDALTPLEFRAMEALALNGEFDAMYPHLMAIGFEGSDDLETTVFITLTGLGPIASPMADDLEAMIFDREALEEDELTPGLISLRMTRAVVLRLTTGQPVDEALADELFDLLTAAAADPEAPIPVQAICALLGSSMESNPSIYVRAVEMTQSDIRRTQTNGLSILANGISNPFNLGVLYSWRQGTTWRFRVPVGGARSGWDPHRALPHVLQVIQETEHDFNWHLAVRMIPAMAPLTPEEIDVLREVALAQEDADHRELLAEIIEYCQWASTRRSGE
jgi:hypothetical protein